MLPSDLCKNHREKVMPIHEDRNLEGSLATHGCRRGAVSIPWQRLALIYAGSGGHVHHLSRLLCQEVLEKSGAAVVEPASSYLYVGQASNCVGRHESALDILVVTSCFADVIKQTSLGQMKKYADVGRCGGISSQDRQNADDGPQNLAVYYSLHNFRIRSAAQLS
jgi:hypothetical protein